MRWSLSSIAGVEESQFEDLLESKLPVVFGPFLVTSIGAILILRTEAG